MSIETVGGATPHFVTDSHITADRVQRIGDSYGLNLSGTSNSRGGSIVLFLLFLLAAGVLVLLIGLVPFVFGMPMRWMLGLDFAAWTIMVTFTARRLFLVSVPKLTGLITTDELFGGRLHPYGTGLHIRYPWEHYTYDDFIDLRTRLTPAPGASTSHFVTKDGIGLSYGWTVQYGVVLPLLALFIRTDLHAIEHGFDEVVLHAGQEIVKDEKVEDVLKTNSSHNLQQGIEHKLATETDVQGNTMEERFGIEVELVTVGPPTFDQEYKEALTAKVLRSLITQDAKAMAQELNIGEEKALQTIMMLNKENVSQQIISLQADEQLAQAAPVILAALQQMGNLRRGGNNQRGAGQQGKPTT